MTREFDKENGDLGIFPKGAGGAFSLLETLVSIALLLLIIASLGGVLSIVQDTFKLTQGRTQTHEAARAAFEVVGRTLSRAMLMADYAPDSPTTPTAYRLHSDLHFICGPQSEFGLGSKADLASHSLFFQAPLGVSGDAAFAEANLLLNATGFLIAYGDDPLRPPALDGRVPSRYRYRLFQWVEPREEMTVYEQTLTTDENGVVLSNPDSDGTSWFSDDIQGGRNLHLLAENIILLVALPRYSSDRDATSYLWNSRDPTTPGHLHRLPHSIELVCVNIDEASAARNATSSEPPRYFPETLFTDPREFDADLLRLEAHLASHSAPSLGYRVYRSTILLSTASPEQ